MGDVVNLCSNFILDLVRETVLELPVHPGFDSPWDSQQPEGEQDAIAFIFPSESLKGFETQWTGFDEHPPAHDSQARKGLFEYSELFILPDEFEKNHIQKTLPAPRAVELVGLFLPVQTHA